MDYLLGLYISGEIYDPETTYGGTWGSRNPELHQPYSLLTTPKITYTL